MLKRMKDYNKLIKRWKDAEPYSRDLHEQIIAKGIEIIAEGYKISEDEYEHGFRQIEYLTKHKLI